MVAGLLSAQRCYVSRFRDLGLDIRELELRIQALFAHKLATPSYWRLLRDLLTSNCGLSMREDDLMPKLQHLGLAGRKAEDLFAKIMARELQSFIKLTYAGKWDAQAQCRSRLLTWLERQFLPMVQRLMPHNDRSSWPSWREMAVTCLGRLRTAELFDIVTQWDPSFSGAIEEIRAIIPDAPSRSALTLEFASVLQQRLLQASVATPKILKFYISLIRVFALLDPRGVLLERVARPVRRYLREREDSVHLIVEGLLAENSDDLLGELSVEMQCEKPEVQVLDLDDLDWMPAPVDAEPDFQSSKRTDVITTMISLFETKEAIVTEFQKVLGERLLQRYMVSKEEVRLVQLLKTRFGDAALQACEVMMRDISDSMAIDKLVQSTARPDASLPMPRFHAQMLSHLFWPPLHHEEFLLPAPIQQLQTAYASVYEKVKSARKLGWLVALGHVVVDLQLEDRQVTESVTAWQASVVYGFQDRSEWTIHDLMRELQMAESLVLNALTFWEGKMVLKKNGNGYVVMENLTADRRADELVVAAAAVAEQATAAPAPAILSEQEAAREKMELYAQYVVGMLTNAGSMPLPQIVMMLKLTVPGGFPLSSDELKTYLEDKVKDGELDYVGGAYRIKAES